VFGGGTARAESDFCEHYHTEARRVLDQGGDSNTSGVMACDAFVAEMMSLYPTEGKGKWSTVHAATATERHTRMWVSMMLPHAMEKEQQEEQVVAHMLKHVANKEMRACVEEVTTGTFHWHHDPAGFLDQWFCVAAVQQRELAKMTMEGFLGLVLEFECGTNSGQQLSEEQAELAKAAFSAELEDCSI